jgi:hypothetical protein
MATTGKQNPTAAISSKDQRADCHVEWSANRSAEVAARAAAGLHITHGKIFVERPRGTELRSDEAQPLHHCLTAWMSDMMNAVFLSACTGPTSSVDWQPDAN